MSLQESDDSANADSKAVPSSHESSGKLAFYSWIGAAAAWAVSFCGGLGTGIACLPFHSACIVYFFSGMISGTILFILVFVVLTLGFSALLQIRLVRRLLLRPLPIGLVFVALAVVGHMVAPHG